MSNRLFFISVIFGVGVVASAALFFYFYHIDVQRGDFVCEDAAHAFVLSTERELNKGYSRVLLRERAIVAAEKIKADPQPIINLINALADQKDSHREFRVVVEQCNYHRAKTKI